MAFTKQAAFTKKVTDLPDTPSPSYTATDIKNHIHTPSSELMTTVNKLVDDLNSSVAGSSGAKNTGASSITGLTGNDIQSLLESLKTKVDEKTDNAGDHLGTWHGYTPTQVDQTLTGRVNDLDAQLAEITQYDFSKNGGRVNDSAFDNTQALNDLISLASRNGGGEILIDPGNLYISGTITLRKNVALKGKPGNYNAASEGGVIIKHTPTVAGTDLFTLETPQAFGLLSGITVENMFINGNSNSNRAFNLQSIANGYFNKIRIDGGFVEGIFVDASLNTVFDNIYINSVETCVHIGSGSSTTLTFNKNYLRGSTTPLIIENCLVATFYDLVLESCVNGADIYKGCNVSFINPYSENVPSSATDVSILNLGINGNVETNPTGVCTIVGGNLAGVNATPHASSSILNVDGWSSLEVLGTKMARAGKIIKTTSNMKHATLNGVSVVTITDTTLPPIVDSTGIVSGASIVERGVQAVTVKDPNTGKILSIWTFDTHATGKANVKFSTIDHVNLIMDCNGNLQVGGADIKPTDMTKCMVFGESANPGTQTIGFNTLGYAKRVDNVTMLHQKTSELKESILLTSHSGTTTGRPTQGRYVGKPYFDTSLNKPIWWNGTAWVDATGTTV